MKTLATITEQSVHPNAPVIDTSHFDKREAVRAVVLNKQGEVALLRVKNKGYHKLPGGGIDIGESKQNALERELLEEIGCSATVTHALGKILEYRDQWQLFQTSYCYVAEQTGEQQTNNLTDEELTDGFEPVWVSDITEAIALLQADKPEDYDGKYIQLRDLAFLQAARKLQ